MTERLRQFCLGIGLSIVTPTLAVAAPSAEEAMTQQLDRCVAIMTGAEDAPEGDVVIETDAGPILLFVQTQEGAPAECKVIGTGAGDDTLVLSWMDGTQVVEQWLKDQPEIEQTELQNWTLPLKPVLACGPLSVIAQPLRVFSSDAPFFNAAPDKRPIEVTFPAPTALCDKYGMNGESGGRRHA